MSQEREKIIVTSAEGIATSRTFSNDAKPGSIMRKMSRESAKLGLNDIIRSCPGDFLPVLTQRLEYIRKKYDADERELVIVADALIENLKAYVKKEVKKPMTPDEAIEEVRKFLAQQTPTEMSN